MVSKLINEYITDTVKGIAYLKFGKIADYLFEILNEIQFNCEYFDIILDDKIE